MVNLPISDYVKSYYQERDIVLDDFTQATIIWISHLAWHEKISALRELADGTTDEALKLQIKDRVDYERNEQLRFMENPDRKYVYQVTECDDGSGHCYFSTIDKALEYGKKNCESTIRIDKITIDPDDGSDTEGFCCWDKNGSVILDFYSYTDLDVSEDTRGKKERFEEASIRCVFPFERGDIVRHFVSGKIGVLETSKADWERFNRRVDAGELYADASDIVVSVAYVGDDGTSYYDHMNVLNLEKTTEFVSKEEENLLNSMSKMLRGEEMLWNYHDYLDQYIRSKQ